MNCKNADHAQKIWKLESSVADPGRFDADPDPDLDPTFHDDADPDPNPFTRVKKIFLQIFNYCCQSLPKLVMRNFLSKNAGARVRGEG